jgi:hypothetical protein
MLQSLGLFLSFNMWKCGDVTRDVGDTWRYTCFFLRQVDLTPLGIFFNLLKKNHFWKDFVFEDNNIWNVYFFVKIL